MKIVYYSKTGKVKKFVTKVLSQDDSITSESISEYSGGRYVLVTSTQGYGEVPKDVEEFLKDNHSNMIAVASSGNRAWGVNLFARSGTIISNMYKVPLIAQFENQGLKNDVIDFIKELGLIGLD